jgi:hypothetical protein
VIKADNIHQRTFETSSLLRISTGGGLSFSLDFPIS